MRSIVNRKIILASASPRRKELLESLGLKFSVHPSDYKEDKNHETPEKTALMHAIFKARDVAKHYNDAIIIGADTIGAYEGQILGKPNSKEHAFQMIKTLSGTTHEVISGLCLIDTSSNKEVSTAVTTEITFESMTKAQISAYVESGEGKDKAASYAIQGLGALFVKEIKGDYFNVVGLPINALYKLFLKLGVSLL